MNDPGTTLPADVPPTTDESFNSVMVAAVEVTPPLPELSPDETGYLINNQFYAGVRFARGLGADKHMFSVTCMAYARDADGRPYLNAAGVPLEGAFTASCEKSELVADPSKADAIRAQALDGAARGMLALIAENVAYENMLL